VAEIKPDITVDNHIFDILEAKDFMVTLTAQETVEVWLGTCCQNDFEAWQLPDELAEPLDNTTFIVLVAFIQCVDNDKYRPSA
jgi:hypothetical protein